jgi:hypothetical protein
MEQDGGCNKLQDRNKIDDGTRKRMEKDGGWNKMEDGTRWRMEQDGGWNKMER